MNQQSDSVNIKKADKTFSMTHPFTISIMVFSAITIIILSRDAQRMKLLKSLLYSKTFITACLGITGFSVWTLNMKGDDDETEKYKKATKQALLGLVIALLAYLDLKAAPFFIIWIVSYYLDV